MSSKLFIIFIPLVTSQSYHFYDNQRDLQSRDTNAHGQWTPDPEEEVLTNQCAEAKVTSLRRIKLPFNLIGQILRYPSHHALEFRVFCRQRARTLTIDFTPEGVRVRFGFFGFQFKRSTKAEDISRKGLSVKRIIEMTKIEKNYSFLRYNCKHFVKEMNEKIMKVKDLFMSVL